MNSLSRSNKEKFAKAKDTVLSVFDTLKTKLQTKLNSIWDSLKGFINKILGGVEKMINKPVNALNSFISKLNKLHINLPEVLGGGTIGFNISPFNTVSIPQLAKGGIVSKPTLSMIGEAGKEAVVPLENNTAWMEKLAALVGNAIAAVLAPVLQSIFARQESGTDGNVVLNLDGQAFATVLVQLIKKYPQEFKSVLEVA